MNSVALRPARLEWLLAVVLRYGSWLASVVIGFGLGLALIDSRRPQMAMLRDMRIATIGIALFILLPVVRVMLMLIVYLRQRDYPLGAAALLVLAIILLGFAAGVAGSRHHDAPRVSDGHATRSGFPSFEPSYIAKSRRLLTATSHTSSGKSLSRPS
jgi:hypothetical protein